MSPPRPRLFTFAAAVSSFLVLGACSESEEPVPIDLSGTGSSSTTDAASTDGTGTSDDGVTDDGASDSGSGSTTTTEDPNAEARQQVIDAAEQQCLDDPDLDEGVVRIVDAETDEVVNEYRVDCDDVRPG